MVIGIFNVEKKREEKVLTDEEITQKSKKL